MARLPTLANAAFAILAVVVVSGCVSGCVSGGSAGSPPQPAAETPTGSASATGGDTCTITDGVRWVRGSAEHDAAFFETYRLAATALETRTAALAKGTWAVSLDADETVLDNSLYQKEREERCQGYSSASWKAWVARQEAGALPGAGMFLHRVHGLGGVIAIVTNRDTGQECTDTEANLHKLDLPYDLLLCQSGTHEKEPRWEAIRKGTASTGFGPLEIVMWIGDNIGDFPGLTQSLNDRPAAAFDSFGSRFFVVPNPMYGSWQ